MDDLEERFFEMSGAASLKALFSEHFCCPDQLVVESLPRQGCDGLGSKAEVFGGGVEGGVDQASDTGQEDVGGNDHRYEGEAEGQPTPAKDGAERSADEAHDEVDEVG